MFNKIKAYFALRKNFKEHQMLIQALDDIADAYEKHTGIPVYSYIADNKVWVECDTVRECLGSADILRMNPKAYWRLFTAPNNFN